ncbi:RING/U-box superfamily protein, putative isoform 1 [Hibiscus syriacus]|uniref:RING/U-box superfamily protein, putative isoform 1 n=1 Tax=Hibiscus syriacus TaxID=106335 RepID=A0A6A2XAB7_HIBSY|nr:RING/U-box superfamily protein, putative isoform 1 [Hibiscus syriacus]
MPTVFPTAKLPLAAPKINRRCIRITAQSQATVTAFSSSLPTVKLDRFSSRITKPNSRGGSQAMLNAFGLLEDDLSKLQVGISSVWYEGNTCNMHLLKLSEAVNRGVDEIGMVGSRFNTMGLAMGTRGMCYSMQSRDSIADSIETVMNAQSYDGNIYT